MSKEHDTALRVLAYRRQLADLHRMARPDDMSDRVEQISELLRSRVNPLMGQLLRHLPALLKRQVCPAIRAAVQRYHVADHKQLQGFKTSVNANGHSGSPDDASDVAGHPAMTATRSTSPHRLSETPE